MKTQKIASGNGDSMPELLGTSHEDLLSVKVKTAKEDFFFFSKKEWFSLIAIGVLVTMVGTALITIHAHRVQAGFEDKNIVQHK